MSKPDLIKDTVKFCRWHLGKGCFAPHTGSDWPAWCAFVYLMQRWTSDHDSQAIEAMRATLACAQSTRAVLETFIQAIPAVGDWCHVATIWPTVSAGIIIRGDLNRDVRTLNALDRSCDYDSKNKPIPGTDRFTLYGWKPEHVNVRTLKFVP